MPGFIIAAGGSDSTAIAALVLAGITLALAIATVGLVISTRSGTRQVREELDLLRRQFGAGHRPLLVDVLLTAPVPADMGAEERSERQGNGDPVSGHPGPTIETKLPGIRPQRIDPRQAFVAFEGQKVYVSVPLRNVGQGLAVIDGTGVALTGPLIEELEYRAVQRPHVPVGETTRIDLIAGYPMRQAPALAEHRSPMRGVTWRLTVPYRDFAGEQRTVARLQIGCHGDDLTGPWLVEHVEQESGGGPELYGDEPPDSSPRARTDPTRRRTGVRREPVVDLWGNPVQTSRRKR
jgi:hypothetical protein